MGSTSAFLDISFRTSENGRTTVVETMLQMQMQQREQLSALTGVMALSALASSTINARTGYAQESTGISIKTPYGTAVQSVNQGSQNVKATIRNGATVYRGGTLGVSNAAEGQFWASESPLNPGYSERYGVSFNKMDFIIGGNVNPNANFITRPAPGLGNNLGGGIEIVTDPFCVKLDFFYMP